MNGLLASTGTNVREALLARLFVIVGGFVVLLLTAALVAPLFIDWTGYRATFEAEASKILGRSVKVAGAASARLLPFPSVTFDDVRVGDDPDNLALSIARFSMDAELAPFLSGDVLIFDMRVTRPSGRITIGADGTTDWALRSQSPFDAAQVRIENLVIDGGQIEIVDEGAGRTHALAIVNAQLSAKALTGPWRLNGNVAFDGEPLAVSMSSGSVSPEGNLPLSVTVTPTQRLFVAEADGNAKATAGRLTWDGGFVLRQAIITDKTVPSLKDSDGVLATVNESSPWRATGKFALSNSGLELPEIRLETGARDDPYVANGKGSMIFGAVPMFELSLEGAQVTFDKGDRVSPVGTDRLAAIREMLNSVPMPEIPGTVSINLPAVVAGDTTIRDVGFSASPENGSWRVRDFRAELPGRTRVEADGSLKTGDAFGFTGKLLVASNQPAGFSNWLTGSVDPAIRNLQALGLSADVTLGSDVQVFDALELAIGSSTFTGQAERRTDGARPSVTAALTGGELPLSALTALSSGLFSSGGANRLASHDVSLSLDAGPVTHDGLEAQKLGLSIRLKEDRIDIDRLMVTGIEGASISATGQVDDVGSKPSASLDASLVSEDASAFVSAVAARLPETSPVRAALQNVADVPGLLSDLQASLVATVDGRDGMQSGSLSYSARTAGGEQILTGTWNGEASDLAHGSVSLNGSVRDDEPVKLLEALGLPVLPLEVPGPVDFTFSGEGSLMSGLAVKSDWIAPGTTVAWLGIITSGNAGQNADGALKMQSEDFDPYLQSMGIVLASGGNGSALNLTAKTRVTGGVATLDDLALTFADAELSGNVSLDVNAERPKIAGRVKAKSLSMPWLAETLYGADATSLSQTAFVQTPYIPTDVDVALDAATADLGVFGSAENLTARFTANSAGLMLEGMRAQLGGGELAGLVEARNDGGNGVVRADFSLKGVGVDALTGTGGVGGTTDASGSVAGSAKSMEGLVSALTGSGVMALTGAQFPGLNPDGFAPFAIMATTGTEAPKTEDVDAMVNNSVRTGAFPLPSDVVAWSLGGGNFRVPTMRAQASGAKLELSMDADVAAATALISGAVTYDAGKAAVTGAEPQVPFRVELSNEQAPVFIVDTAPINQYLTQAALEREQARVEAMQAGLIEKQRLRRDVRRIALLYAERDRRASIREDAVRREAARRAGVLLEEWNAELARREEAAKAKREAEEKARQAAEDAAARKALEAVAKEKIAPAQPAKDQSLEDVFKSLDLNLNP